MNTQLGGCALVLVLSLGCTSGGDASTDEGALDPGGMPGMDSSTGDDDEPSVEEPSPDEPSVEEPSPGEPSPDEPNVDDPNPDDPSPDDPSPDEPVDEPSPDEPSPDEPRGGSGGMTPSSGGSPAPVEEPEPSTPGECGAISTFADGLEPDREIHVATTGDDGNDGSAENPVASIERGIQLATPGTAVRIHEGTYAGGAYVSGVAGEADAPIWVGGVPGEARPIIEGGGEALHLSAPRYVVLHDLEIAGQESNGINVDDGEDLANEDAARHLVFRNLYIHDIGTGGNQDCLKLSGVNDHFVLDSRFERCGEGGSAIDHVGCHRGLLARNVIEDVGGSGIQSKGGSFDIEMRGNLFLSAGQRPTNLGGSTGFEFFRPPLSDSEPNSEARNIRAIANVFVGGVAAANFVGCVDCLAANNTIIDPERWVVRILQETVSDGSYEFLPASGGRFINNLVVYSRGVLSTHVNVGEGTDASSFVFANNLWYASDSPGESAPDLPVVESDGVVGDDPGLSDDYSIAEGSPAAGAGVALDELGADFAGECYRDPPSIGAFEW